METSFTISEIRNTACDQLKSQKSLIGNYTVYILISLIVASIISNWSAHINIFGQMMLNLITFFISSIFSVCSTQNCLQVAHGERPTMFASCNNFNKIFNCLFGTILFSLITGIGFLLLFIPGVYLAARLQFFIVAIVEDDLSIMASLRRSWEITRKEPWHLIGANIIMMLIGLLGLLCLGIGYLVAAPIIGLMSVGIYHKLYKEEANIYTAQ